MSDKLQFWIFDYSQNATMQFTFTCITLQLYFFLAEASNDEE